MNMILSMLREAAASKTSKVPRTFRSKKSYEFFSPRLSWIPCQAAMCTMQSQARNISVSFDRSRIDPSIKSAPFFNSRGARTSRITGVSPWSSTLGTRVWPRFPDPPVSSTFRVAGDHDEAAHLAGVQQPIRIDAALEGELVGIGALVPCAVLE